MPRTPEQTTSGVHRDIADLRRSLQRAMDNESIPENDRKKLVNHLKEALQLHLKHI